MNRGVVEAAALGAVLGALVLLWVAARSRYTPARPDGGYAERGHRELPLGIAAVRANARRWLTTTNHRDIGILYIVFGTVAAIWGGIDGMMMRVELLTPPADVWSPETYNAIFTTHGLTMLIFFVTPVFFGIGNYFLPLLIDADDMAFPRVNAIGFWLLPPALLLARAGLIVQVTGQFLGLFLPPEAIEFFVAVREPGVGWTLYTPLSVQSSNPQVDLLLVGLHLSGVATTVGAINFIATVVYERADDVGWDTLDIFSWNMVVTSGLALFAFPLLGSALVMLLMDRNLGTTFFTADGGGAVLWQHLFWFWGHPEVYILFLPATGLMSAILPKFVGRKLFGFRYIVYSTLGIGVLSFGVWAHHMFTTGVDPRILASFMAISIAIAVPSAIKVFNWITTMWDGDVRLTAPLILCVGSIGTFIVGGVTGVFLAVIPVDVLYHATYYVVGHFHLIVVGIIPFMMMAASYYWYPLMTGRWYDRLLAKFQAALLVLGSTVTFGTLLVMGALGLPRRHAIYPAEFAGFQRLASIGAFVMGMSVLLWLFNMVWSYWTGRVVESTDPWNLKATDQFTREWQWFEDRMVERYDVEPAVPETTRESFTTDPDRGTPSFSRAVEPVAGEFLRNASRAAISGLVGTLLLSGILFPAASIGVLDPGSLGELAGLVGLPGNVAIGYVLFLLGGTVTWPLLFLALSEYLPGRLLFVKGLTFTTVISPGFALAFYSGQTGLALVGYVGFVLISHWIYGIGLAATLQYLRVRGQAGGGAGGEGGGDASGGGSEDAQTTPGEA